MKLYNILSVLLALGIITTANAAIVDHGNYLSDSETNIDWLNVALDTVSAWKTDYLEAPEDGDFRFDACIRFNASVSPSIYLYKDTGAGYTQIKLVTTTATNTVTTFSSSIYLNKGDKVAFRPTANVTLDNNATLHWIHISKNQSGKQIAMSQKDTGFAYTDGGADGNIPTATLTQVIYDTNIKL